ncbi:DUF6928 family protein [Streptomyces decoyicus]
MRRVRPTPGYARPFHPIDLGNEALKQFFGFLLEGRDQMRIRAPGVPAVTSR